MKKVLKFGGTSVGSAGNMKKVASIVADQRQVTVLSAMSGTTDALVAINRALADGSDIPDEKLSELEDKYRRCADSVACRQPQKLMHSSTVPSHSYARPPQDTPERRAPSHKWLKEKR